MKNKGVGFIDKENPPYFPIGKLHGELENKETQKAKAVIDLMKEKYMKLLFLFLLDEETLRLSQRELAERCQVSLGTVNKFLKDLKDVGYLKVFENKKRVLLKKKELISNWAHMFSNKLRVGFQKRRFRKVGGKQDWWKDKNVLKDTSSYFGGDVAAYHLTKYLEPEKVNIYTKDLAKLSKNLKIVQDREGDIEVLECFWADLYPQEKDELLAPPLVVFADLINQGDSRSLEAAGMIFKEYLEK